jgi:sec-independent protein translocase protein TatA
MGALAPWHWIVIIVVIFLLFGGRLLPRIGKSFGQSLTGVKKGLKEGTEQFKAAVADEPEAHKPAASESASVEAPPTEGAPKDL